MMKSFTLLVLMFFVVAAQAQVYEDFEGGPKINWNAINGQVYEGSVDNPDKSGINTSDKVGKLVNDGIGDFNFILGDLAAPADLSVNSLLKMKVWSPIATKVLFKMEGGGKAIEKFVDLTTTNQWVDMTFDLSGGSGFTTLSKILIAVNPFTTPVAETFYFDDIRGIEPRSVYETFESGNEMGWLGLDGVLEAPVANPAPNKINGSANCGKYTKSDKHAYSLLLSDRGSNAFDLSVNNQFKVQVHASAPTQVLFKLEGPGGPAIEKIANIGVSNQWQEYTFDFSSAKESTHLTKAILFFDPGVETSSDVYYFDNISAVPIGSCGGVPVKEGVIDDFECNRFATYVNGWDSLTVVANPAPGGSNTSTKVGKYNDPLGEAFGALVIDYQNPIDLSTKNQLKAKIHSPKAVPILFKLEGGSSPAKEIWVNVTEPNSWVEYAVDFSDQALASHKKIVFFFNAGNDGLAGDVYYIDDIALSEKTTTDLENFETGASLPWEPLDQLAIHGTFSVENNPAPEAPNTSAKVGKYVKGSAAFSTLSAVAPGAIDISAKPQYNLDVLAPVGSTSVTFQLEGVSGNADVTRDIKNAGKWETISFDFTNAQGTDEWNSLRLIFNPGKAEEGAIFYFDNLNQSAATIDPCENTQIVNNIIDDFECQRNNAYGAGADRVSAVSNPKVTTANSSTKVGLYKDPAGESFAALCANFDEPIVLDAFNQLSVQVLSANADIPFLMKLEGGTSPAKEIWTSIKLANEWETISVDFSGEKGSNHKRVCLFFNGGVEPAQEDNYHFDNFQFAHAPFDGCIINFDDAAFLSTEWRFFPADNSGAFELVDNPKVDDNNKSPKVGKAVEKASGEQPWQGMYTDLPSYIKFGSNKLVKMKVLSPQVGAVTMKLERPLKEGAPGSGDNTIVNTKANEWEELTWDFSTTPIVDDGQYARVTLIWDINNVPASDVVYYFDDIKTDGGDCGDIVATDDEVIGQLAISPNPVHDILNLKNMEASKFVIIKDVMGRDVAVLRNDSGSNTQFVDVSKFVNGTYIVTAFGEHSKAIAVAKFIKF